MQYVLCALATFIAFTISTVLHADFASKYLQLQLHHYVPDYVLHMPTQSQNSWCCMRAVQSLQLSTQQLLLC